MLHSVTFRTLAIAACGWLLACEASALTVGRARGAVLIGRPLEIAIPITLDSATDRDGPCASGELFYGEQQVSRPPSMRWQAGPGAEGTLFISSALPVDEPSVTLTLRVGCAQATTRRFVLLSELPGEVEPSALAPRPALPAVTQPAPAGSVAVAPSSAAPAARAPARSSPRREAAAAAAPSTPAPAFRTRRSAGQPPRQVQVQARSRLKVEPLVPGVERDPILRLTAELATQLAADPTQRQAAAALWAALQKSPDEAIRDGARLQSVQRDVESLRNVTRQNAAAVAEMQTQVDKARSERQTASFLVLGLSALLAALLAGLAWRWYRTRQVDEVGRWFDVHGDGHASVEAALTPAVARPPVAVAPAARTAAKPAARPARPAARGASGPAAPPPAPATGPASTWAAPEDFQASRGGTVRMVGVDELIDVHDKADFFLSIGAVDQAMAVLEAHIHDQVETSALAWMDLLELYHAHGRRTEYERVRAEFVQRFAAQVPDYEHFDQPTASLENYSRALSRIVALWPSPKVLDVIEESIFRKPGLPGAEPFSLEAYRELVLLYHVAKEVAPAPEQRGDSRITSFGDTSLQPLNMLEQPEASEADRERMMVPPASVRLGVDIDLDGDEVKQEAAETSGDLPPLDFDVSSYDEVDGGDGREKRG